MMISVENVNRVFPNYPMTVKDKGWIYGVWYCGTSWTKVSLHGEYPPTFLKRALALFPEAKDILHCPSGCLEGPGMTVDLIADKKRCPQIVADASTLPFPDNSFDLYLSDPPYSVEDADIYGTPKFPIIKAVNEAHRILRPGGYFGMLHVYYPSYRKQDWNLLALIAVVTGFMRKTRMFSILQKPNKKQDCKGWLFNENQISDYRQIEKEGGE